MVSGTRDERRLSAIAVFALALNGIVGVGIFFAPAAIARAVGSPEAVPAAFLWAAVAFAPSVLVYARLASLLPIDGGPVAHARAAFGNRVASIVGLVAVFASIASSAAVLRALGEALYAPAARGASLALLGAFAVVTSLGLRASARTWTLLTALKVVAILALVAGSGHADLINAGRSFAWPGTKSVLIAAFCFQGFEIVSLVAGRGPAAGPLLLAFIGATTLYVLVLGRGVDASGLAFAMVTMTPRYAIGVLRSWSERRALGWTSFATGALVAAGSLGELFETATLAVVAQYAASALALVRLARAPVDRALAVLSLVPALGLASTASAREGALFVVVLFAAGALSRTVTGESRARHEA